MNTSTIKAVMFRVMLPPYGKKRPRFTCPCGRGRTYTDPADVVYEAAVDVSARAGGLRVLPPGPVAVEITAYIRRPQRLPHEIRNLAHPPAPVKPDCDNLAKACLDGLKMYFRDERVTSLIVHKVYCAPGEQPRCDVSVVPAGTLYHLNPAEEEPNRP